MEPSPRDSALPALEATGCASRRLPFPGQCVILVLISARKLFAKHTFWRKLEPSGKALSDIFRAQLFAGPSDRASDNSNAIGQRRLRFNQARDICPWAGFLIAARPSLDGPGFSKRVFGAHGRQIRKEPAYPRVVLSERFQVAGADERRVKQMFRHVLLFGPLTFHELKANLIPALSEGAVSDLTP